MEYTIQYSSSDNLPSDPADSTYRLMMSLTGRDSGERSTRKKISVGFTIFTVLCV